MARALQYDGRGLQGAEAEDGLEDAESLDQGPGPAELDVCVRSASSRFSYRDVSLCIDMQLRWRAVGRVEGEEDQLPGRVASRP